MEDHLTNETAYALKGSVFDFGLNGQQEDRAARLHRENLIIDLLYQGPLGPDTFSDRLQEVVLEKMTHVKEDVSGLFELTLAPARLAVAGELEEFHSHWIASGVTGGNREIEMHTFEMYASLMGLAQSQFDHFPWMRKALCAEDFRAAKREGMVAGYVSTQLVAGPFTSLAILEHAHEAGLRMVQLTYNSRNTIGCGCTAPENSGVTNFGRSAIALMNSLGIIVDTAHCGQRTTMDACELSTRPVVASHTAASAVFDHDRCKSDEEIRAIAATGGVVGIVAVPFFLSTAKQVTIESMLDHVDHVAGLVGAAHVAIGTDWPNQLPNSALSTIFQKVLAGVGFRREHAVDPSARLHGFQDYLDFPNITRGLVARGYSDSEIKGILGENFLRVFSEVCG